MVLTQDPQYITEQDPPLKYSILKTGFKQPPDDAALLS